MNSLSIRRFGIALALVLGSVPAVAGIAGQAPAIKPEQYIGQVVPLAELIAKLGGKLDADAADASLALVMDDGKVLTLVKDDFSRMFFKDKRLLKRPMRLTGRILPNSQVLQVINVHSYIKGQLHQVYYWCEICSIKAYEPSECACCFAQVELREEPVK
jgi:hypothetical protein